MALYARREELVMVVYEHCVLILMRLLGCDEKNRITSDSGVTVPSQIMMYAEAF